MEVATELMLVFQMATILIMMKLFTKLDKEKMIAFSRSNRNDNDEIKYYTQQKVVTKF